MTDETIDELHSKIRAFFELRGFKVQLRGNPMAPTIIINDGLIIGARVERFSLVFYDRKGNILETVKMNMNIRRFPTGRLIGLLMESDNAIGYRLRLKNSDLFVAGWQKDVRKSRFHSKEMNYPLLSRYNPLVMTKENALAILERIDPAYEIEIDQYVPNSMLVPTTS